MLEDLGFASGSDLMRAATLDERAVEIASGVFAWVTGSLRPTAWGELDPMLRSVDGATPVEVLDDLDLIQITVEQPQTWKTAQASLCVRQSIGWGPCVLLWDGFGEEAAILPVYIDRGDALELWLLDAEASWASATQPLQVFGTTDLPGGEVWRLTPHVDLPGLETAQKSIGTLHAFDLTEAS